MKAQIKGFIAYRNVSWDDEQYKFIQCEFPEQGYITVMPYTLEVDIPDSFDPRGAQVEALKAEKQKAMADFQARITDIDRQISELTALEFVNE